MTSFPDTNIRKVMPYSLASFLYYLCGAYVMLDWSWIWHFERAADRMCVIGIYAIFLILASMYKMCRS